MSEPTTLETLQVLHRDLLALCEKRLEAFDLVADALDAAAAAFRKFLDKAPRSAPSRTAVQTGKIRCEDEEYQMNADFQNKTLQLADFLELDEQDAARILLDAEADQVSLNRSLMTCGVIRFYQYRKYMLDCVRLLLKLSTDADLPTEFQEFFLSYVSDNILCITLPSQPGPQAKIVPKCLAGIREVRQLLRNLADLVTRHDVGAGAMSEFQDTVEYTRVSLLQQHELLGVILCMVVEKDHAAVADFEDFLTLVRKTEKYDSLLAHIFPVLGAFLSLFGSPDSARSDLEVAKKINTSLCKPPDDQPWTLPFLAATVRAWWLAEYSGWYVDNSTAGIPLDDVVREEAFIAEKFMDCLKDGAFDMFLSIAADVQPVEWKDPVRTGMRVWLQTKAPNIQPDTIPFSDYFRNVLMSQLEVFVDSFITNLPDVLRRLRVEEDEQRQLSHDHEQDLNLERFLMIIAYTYDGRPAAGATFWDDPDSNLAGFMQWASRRASTPLVSVFCEALQSISENEECASAAHQFLNEKTTQASGKMRQSLSLTWAQIFKELVYFSSKIRERPTLPQSHVYRGSKAPHEPTEVEPESAMMLESYLRLITKLSLKSLEAREFLLKHPDFSLVEVLYELAGGAIPRRLRACTFTALRSLMTLKLREDGEVMWTYLDAWMTGGFQPPPSAGRPGNVQSQSPVSHMESIFAEIGNGFEEPNSFIQFLTILVAPPEPYDPMTDTLPFPETLGSTNRMPGIELYVDFVLGHVFSIKSAEVGDVAQLRLLRLNCLEFASTCLSTFNENLIIVGSETNINVDQAISTTDLATYVRLHPFARVMEWMFNDKVLETLLASVHQDPTEVGNAAPDSPLILGILRAVQIISKVLDLQATYLDLVRKQIKLHASPHRTEVSNTSYGGIEDGLMSHLSLVVDLGAYCGIGHPELTLACLKLLEQISTSNRIITAWNPGTGRGSHRNKAIVALESNQDGDAIAGAFVSELTAPLDRAREDESANYEIKIYMLDFLFAGLKATPRQPTIAHLLLGFKCEPSSLSIEPKGAFDQRTSLFHNLIRVLLETPFGDDTQVRHWLVNLKYKVMRVLSALWSSPLSSSIVMTELRENDLLFHLLLREMLIQPALPWEGRQQTGADFIIHTSGLTLINFLSTRAMMLEYVSMELCGVAKGHLPTLKRRIFDALNGQVRDDNNNPMDIPTIFDLFDFLQDNPWNIDPPTLTYCADITLSTLLERDAEGNMVYSHTKAKEVLELKRGEFKSQSQLVTEEQLQAIEEEEGVFLTYLLYMNRMTALTSARLRVLGSWCNVLLMMLESADFRGATKISFLLQALQAILPSLELCGDAPDEALHLAGVAKILLYRIEFSEGDVGAADASVAGGLSVNGMGGAGGKGSLEEREHRALGTLISDKLHQLFQMCLEAVGKWAGDGELRTVYYTICYRYLTAMVDRAAEHPPHSHHSQQLAGGKQSLMASTTTMGSHHGPHGRPGAAAGPSFLPAGAARRALHTVSSHGERLLNVICDDAYSSDSLVQTSALTLLRGLVTCSVALGDLSVIESLNRINFIGVVVDSLRGVREEWLTTATSSAGFVGAVATADGDVVVVNDAALRILHTKLSLLLALASTKLGSKYLLHHHNLLRTVEASGLFSADPELLRDYGVLATHYGVLSRVGRVVGAAVVARGEGGVQMGRRFLGGCRGLVVHVLKRSAGIGMPGGGLGLGGRAGDGVDGVEGELRENVEELAEAFMVLISATGFLEFESDQQPTDQAKGPAFFT